MRLSNCWGRESLHTFFRSVISMKKGDTKHRNYANYLNISRNVLKAISWPFSHSIFPLSLPFYFRSNFSRLLDFFAVVVTSRKSPMTIEKTILRYFGLHLKCINRHESHRVKRSKICFFVTFQNSNHNLDFCSRTK